MRTGRHFPIPQGPADLRTLWDKALPLDDATRPRWLPAEDDEGDFRLAGSVSLAGLDAAARAAALEEFNTLEYARLVVEEDARRPDVHHVYVREPRSEPVWSIGIRTGPSPWALVSPADDEPALTAAHVTDAQATSVADPFLLHRDGRWHMLFEVDDWLARKGAIGLATSSDGHRWRYERIILDEPFHLSYPCVFEHGGDVWMVPETAQAEAVRLYRARRFPDDWEHVADLLAGEPFADATPFQHDGRWWMFVETSGAAHDTLRLFAAPDLPGPWEEHPRSPVVQCDAVRARPAGPVIASESRLVRLAQNCTPAYGTDVRGIEILTLTSRDYAERPMVPHRLLGPSGRGWNACGMHHLAATSCADGTWLVAADGWRLEGPP
ncbi:MAG: hypothetical protein ACKO40_05470 [Planctomycetaceae bacterium]